MGGKTTTSTNKVTIPQDVLDRYNSVNAQAQQVAQNPFQRYGENPEDFVAQFNEQQLKGVGGINAVAGMGAAYENVGDYLNPYIKNVADTTRAQMEQAQEQAQSGALGTAVSSGAFGGDRAGVAAANLANQNQMAMGSTMAGIYGEGYNRAIDTSMNDRNRLLGVAGAQLGAGTQMQQTEQAGKDALINQFMQQQGYPFQVAQFLANIAMGTGALSGSTTTSTQQGSFFSDRRLKHDIQQIGKADNGLPIYTFKYKGDPEQHTHVGFMADEVEKKNPEAVGLDPSGYKTVNYDKATQSMGGGVHPHHKGEAFADGGVAGPYGSKVGQGVGASSYIPQAYLPVGELMMADPDVAAQHQASLLDTLNSAATTGKTFMDIRDEFKSSGGVAGGYAGGGGVQPQAHGDYMSSTLAAQAANKDKPELKTAAPPEHPESTFGQIVKLASTVIPMMNTGGVAAGRHGYALDGTVEQQAEQRIRDALSASVNQYDQGGNGGMRQPSPVARNEIPAPQTLGSMPDAKVMAAEAPRTEDESARAYRMAASNRFNAEPTGVVPVEAPVSGQVRPMPRPEGLAAASTPTVFGQRPEPRPKAIEDMSSGYESAREHFRTKVIPVESFGGKQFDPKTGQPLTSSAGAVGAAQVMEATGPEAAALAGLPWDRDLWLNDADYNMALGEAYYLDQYRKFGSLDKADAAYNAGPTAVREAINASGGDGSAYINALPSETQEYLKRTGSMPNLSSGVAGGTGEDRLGTQQGGVKPYEERNVLGKILYNKEDGKLNKDAMLSLVAGLGDMLSSQSPFLLPSIGAGLSGAANTYMAREGQLADIAGKQAETANTAVQLLKNSIYYDQALGQSMIPLQGGGQQSLIDFINNPAGPSMAGVAADQVMRDLAAGAKSRGIDLSTATPEQIFGGGAAPTATPAGQGSAAQAPAAGMPVPQVVAPFESFGTFPLDEKDQAFIQQAEVRSRSPMTPQERELTNAQAAEIRAAADSGTAAASLAFRNTNELAYTVAKEAANNDLGPLGAYKAGFEALATQVADQFGVQYDGTAASSATLLNKLSSLSADQMTADTAAASLYLQNKNIFPNIDTDPVAAAEITAEMMTKNMNSYERGQFVNDLYRAQKGTVKDLTGADARFNEKAGGVYQVEKTNIADLLKYAGNARADPELKKLIVDFFDSSNRGAFQSQGDAQAALEAIFSVLPGQHKVSSGLGRYFVQQGNP